jgi:uncharacterized membrane protein
VTFANPLPWWAIIPLLVGAAAVAWFAYSRRRLPPRRRNTLVALRFITLLALILFLLRPVAREVNLDARDVVVPILVDTSRSMSLEDAGQGRRRIEHARQVVADRLLPTLGSQFRVEVLGFGEAVTPTKAQDLSAVGRRSDLGAALSSIKERYRGHVLAGIVLLSDGGDTSGTAEHAGEGSAPIYALGFGSKDGGKDREILSVTAADTVLDDSRVDLAVSAVSHGLGAQPIELRLLENGKLIDARRVTPAADGTPIREVFQVSPGRGAPSVYTVETPKTSGELVPENNARSVLVQPPVRARRVLLVEGAPGFEHSFLKRALAADSGLEIDSVVRKGKNEQGADTYYIQAARSRGDALTSGYPRTREVLFHYDTLVLANVEGHLLSRAQLDATRAFVSQRGGGLLVLGAKSFLRQGLGDTVLEEVLPLDLSDRTASTEVLPASDAKGMNRVSLTSAGEGHPIMQLAPNGPDTRKRWDAIPSLASIVALGRPRPAASVLAVTSGSGGTSRPLVAVQRYGEGRSMIFAGEASWRWKMLMPASDRSYETFWKQTIRWLSLPASDPVDITAAPGGSPGETMALRVVVRDGAFEPQRDAAVDVRVNAPDGKLVTLHATPDAAAGDGHYVATFRPEQSGVFKVAAEARRGSSAIGTAATSILVGGVDVEMTDPRLNEQLLRRIAASSGGRLLPDDQLTSLPGILKAALPAASLTVPRDLWHTGWSFAMILVLLGAEWILRRRWGLR